MTALEFHNILRDEERINGFSIYGLKKVEGTLDSTIIPLDCKSGQHHYEVEKHGPKTDICLNNCFQEILVIIDCSDFEDDWLLNNYKYSYERLY